MVVLNDLDRYHLVADGRDRVPKLGYLAAHAKEAGYKNKIDYQTYMAGYGDGLPDIID
ncbi:MAG: hypothetical protein NPIRA03_26630 [Nitrospirales bacterium]|nr:MAG: hypothetical protein NPIRA03_26630 [Nitrospirales bacterium]